MPQVQLTRPKGLAPQLFFGAYHGPNVVAFAQLSTRTANKFQSTASANDGELFAESLQAPGVSYCLKQIEVKQNYRNQGIGSALLDEVIRFCKDQRVTTLYGEAKGDLEILRRWYSDKGFEVDGLDNIQLSIA
ncbi:MAG: GNAT family N-acetyltransferase [Pseudomonadales bacterium]|nr:GNAT family N-acetyltransferase [Pseudomonadales bacterium]